MTFSALSTLKTQCIAQVCDELRDGRKRSHWMWFVFPQIQGLGSSAMAQRFAISSLAEAEAYLRHPLLGPRLRESTRLVNFVKERSIEAIFGYPDYLKFRSSISLFARATNDNEVFVEALRKYFGGEADPQTSAVTLGRFCAAPARAAERTSEFQWRYCGASIPARIGCAGPVEQQMIGAGFGQPDFARAAHHLTYVRVRARQRKHFESLGTRVKAH